MNETIRKADTTTLWALLADITQLLEIRKYKPDTDSTPFMFWYQVYKEIVGEIDRRMIRDYGGLTHENNQG